MVHTANEWIRLVLRGVAGYAHEQGQWDFLLEPYGLDDVMHIPTSWKPDGIITRLTSDEWENEIRESGIPTVNVSWLGEHSLEIPKVASDELACGVMAAEHYLDRGFRSFGYVGPINRLGYKDQLGQQFQTSLKRAGFECPVLQPEVTTQSPLHLFRDTLTKWVLGLPKPVAILVWNSEISREITYACRAEGIDVPTGVAVLCVEFDSVMSSLAPVPLSNLNQSGSRVGYEAAKLLHSLMEGGEPPEQPILIPPVGVVHRQSTDTMAVDDQVVSAAARFIADNIMRPIKVQDICRSLDVSRRNLETRFLNTLGRSPAAEVRRARIERVKRLLVETDLPLRAIAKQSGYNHTEVMIRNFSKQIGISPGEFRHSH